ncbi:ErmE/ErmH/ErmO/ErmR family 23S rRNA (adenine(2058)-N(6))-methyltransferase [Nocardia thailandica]
MAHNHSSRRSGYGHHAHTRAGAAGGRHAPRDRRRELSQNFLVDRRAVDLIVRAADPCGRVLEPGAGAGILTRALAGRGAAVTAYEIDHRLAATLAARCRGDERIRVIRGDFLRARPPREPFAVVGNIPFSATAGIVDWCLAAPGLTSATLVTQLEYARKRTGDYGRWSLRTVATWPWFDWELAGRVGRDCFRPVPSVDSGVLRLTRRPRPLVADRRAYTGLVRLGFTGIGGSVRASLRTRCRGVDAALAHAGIAPHAVVGHVHPEQWVRLAEVLTV